MATITTLNATDTITSSRSVINTNFSNLNAAIPAVSLASGKTLTVNNSLTLAGTDATVITFQGTDTYVGRATTDTLTNKTFDTAGAGNSLKINGTSVSAVNGSGSIVLTVSPALTTPSLGVATATSINKVAITAPATSATLTIADGKTLTASNSITVAGVDGKTLTANNSLTLAGTDATTVTFQGTDTYVGRTTTDTLTNKRITRRVGTTASSATPTINTDNTDIYVITAQAAAITSFTTNLSGTPSNGDLLQIAITDNGTARAITWGSSFEASTVALPTTTVISTRLDVGFVWNAATSKWRCICVA